MVCFGGVVHWILRGGLMVAIGGFGWCGSVRCALVDVNTEKEKKTETKIMFFFF